MGKGSAFFDIRWFEEGIVGSVTCFALNNLEDYVLFD